MDFVRYLSENQKQTRVQAQTFGKMLTHETLQIIEM